MLIDSGKVVHLGLTVFDDAGERLQTDSSSLDVIIGFGQLLPKVERTIIGLAVGARRTVELQPAEAFGEYDELKVLQFAKDDFPSDVQMGDSFEAEGDQHEVVNLTVMEVNDDHILVDLNHALAGKCVTIQFEVLAIRSATRDEIEVAMKRRPIEDLQATQALLPANALLGGRTRR